MTIEKIVLSGFRNLGRNEITLHDITSLVAPNNYGKSNILEAIVFGVDFIRNSSDKKISMMRLRELIPINTQLEGVPFTFELQGSIKDEVKVTNFIYGYSFQWEKNNSEDKGAYIFEEHLKLKAGDDPKYRNYILREEKDTSSYLASPAGRCTKNLPVGGDILAINKLSNFDDLFYLDIVTAINKISVKFVRTMRNPNDLFSTIAPHNDVNSLTLQYPRTGEIGFYINSLKELDHDKYELLHNTIMDLLPEIEDFKPVKVVLKHSEGKEKDLPFVIPDAFYDIQVKERYNNQYTSINNLSAGCKRLLYIFTMVIAAQVNNVQLVMLEELENSVHPKLLQNVLTVISQLAGDTKILLTSHSPYLVNYLDVRKIQFGLPAKCGIATFKEVKASKVSRLEKQASAEEMSLGEYVFGLMQDLENDDEYIKTYFDTRDGR
jgi:AAA15 family ATPase/GTPase